MTDKNLFRKTLRSNLKNYNTETLNNLSIKICEKVIQNKIFEKSKTILMYQPIYGEVDIKPLIDKALNENKNVILPVVKGENLVLRIFDKNTELQKGAFGIWEPQGDDFKNFENIDCALIPGMAFDKFNHRLGRGKGYYDRLLPILINAYKIGICFDFQYFDTIPHENHDVKMDLVIW